MEVHCPLAEGSRTQIEREAKTKTATFLKGYSMSISYDKKHFGKEMDLFIIDTKCQLADLEVDPPVFALKVHIFGVVRVAHLISFLFVRLVVLNATFNDISVISWRSVLLVEETGGPGENH
jgi:hypothetical protein